MIWRFVVFQDSVPACACSDCEESCPVPPPEPPAPMPLTIGGVDAFTVIMAVVFVVGTALFLMGVCLFPARQRGDGKNNFLFKASEGGRAVGRSFNYSDQME